MSGYAYSADDSLAGTEHKAGTPIAQAAQSGNERNARSISLQFLPLGEYRFFLWGMGTITTRRGEKPNSGFPRSIEAENTNGGAFERGSDPCGVRNPTSPICRRPSTPSADSFWKPNQYSFIADDLLRNAVLHKSAIIGEEAARFPDAFRARHPHIERGDVAAFRNIIVHA